MLHLDSRASLPLMKVTAKISQAHEHNRPFWSFEFFPPKTAQGVLNLYDRLERMYRLKPEFIDVTWGAGGSTSQLTLEICTTAQSQYNLETCMHLTCTNMPREKIDAALKQAKETGIQNIFALRGDPPRGVDTWEKVETGFSYAADLVAYIRKLYGDYFCIGVAGYPEGHSDCTDLDKEIHYLKQKVDAGADYIITQLFYDPELFLEWVKKCRNAGIEVPILPGIMPIQSYNGFVRMTTLCRTSVPSEIRAELDAVKNDDQAVREYGVKQAVDMCLKLKNAGIQGFHFYTLNLEHSTQLILENLKFVSKHDYLRPLPWNPSQIKGREKESVRPIFWKYRTESYLSRTDDWDEYPNGRWGDSRSPAYGELDGYGISLKFTKNEVLKMWNTPTSVEDIKKVFMKYFSGKIRALPWSDLPLNDETNTIRKELEEVIDSGYLTINSQPAVNGVKSSDRIFGWGPKNGYVYQKAYLEFFVNPEKFKVLLDRVKKEPYVSIYAVNRQGELHSNCKKDCANAVTWGVFPNSEVLQPTIVEEQSFLAWKDEAFLLWDEWAGIYEEGSTSRKFLQELANTWFLVNIVHNNFTDSNAIFQVLP